MAHQIPMPENVRRELPKVLLGKSIAGIKLTRLLRAGTTAQTFVGTDEYGHEYAVKLVPRENYGASAPLKEIARLVDADERHLVVPSLFRELDLTIAGAKYRFLFFKSRLVRGETLHDFLASGAVFPVKEEVTRFISHMHTALDQLERLHLNHGDLHSKNIVREVVGEGGPTPEVRYVVIDFSEAHDRHQLKAGCAWDVTRVGEHIGNFYRIVSQRDDLSRTDEDVLQAIERLPSYASQAATEENLPVRAEEIAVRYSEALLQVQNKPRKLTNPFDAWSAEYIPNDALLVSLCHVDSHSLRELLEGPGNVVLCGPRGSGKSTLFRRFRFLTKVTAAAEMEILRQEITGDDYVAFYVPCEALFNLRFANLGEADVKENADKLRTYFNMAVFGEVAKSVAALPEELGPVSDAAREAAFRHLSEEAGTLWGELGQDRIGHTWPEMAQAAYAVMRGIQRAVACADRVCVVGGQNDFILRLIGFLQEGVAGFAGRHFIVFLDDYTDDRVPFALQEELDHIVTHRASELSFKISSHMFGSIYTSSRRAAPDEWRNFRPYDLGWHYMSRPREEERMLLDILNKRIDNCTSISGTVEQWLGVRSLPGKRDLAYALYDEDTRNGSVYHGVECLIEMCTGDFSEMIRLAHRIFREGEVVAGSSTRTLDPAAQHKAIVSFSREHLQGVQYIVPHGKELYDIVRGFGTYARQCLREKKLVKKGDSDGRPGLVPYRALTAYVEDLSEADAGSKRLWEALQKASLFVNALSAPSRAGGFANRATLRRLLCPAFSLPFKESEHLSLRVEDFEYWMKHPAEWEKTKFRDTVRAAVGEPLFSDLRAEAVDAELDVPPPELDTSEVEHRDWSRQAPAAWRSVVAAMPPAVTLGEMGDLKDYDVVIAAVGFEERTTGALQSLVDAGVRARQVLTLEIGKYPRETQQRRDLFNSLVGAVTGGKAAVPTSSPVDHPDNHFVERLAEALDSVSSAGARVAFDCTSCPSLVLTQALHVLMERDIDLTILYTEPQTYVPSGEDSASGSIPRFQPFTGVRFVAAPPRLQAADIAQLPLVAVIFPTYTAERTGKAIAEIQPARQLWLFSEPDLNDDTEKAFSIPRRAARTLLRPDDIVSSVSRFDYRGTMLALGGIYATFRQEYRVVLIPHGSKMQTLGAMLFRVVHDSASFVFAMPQNYDPSRFSRGTKATWAICLGRTVLLKEKLRDSRVLGRT